MNLIRNVCMFVGRRWMALPWHCQSMVSAVSLDQLFLTRMYSRIGPEPKAFRNVRSMEPVTAIPRLYMAAVVPGSNKLLRSVGDVISRRTEACLSHSMFACACGERVDGSAFLS